MQTWLAHLKQVAEGNFCRLGANPYPGRIIVAGRDETGENLVQVYAIMGRSENSRNRVFGSKDGCLFTEAADPSKVKDASLIIYDAMTEAIYAEHPAHVVSNGNQTNAVYCSHALGLHQAMGNWRYEPDAPNFTPRITAVSRWLVYEGTSIIEMSLLRKSPWSDQCDRYLYEINDIGPGFGYCLTTYAGDGKPLPSFQGEPYLLPLHGDANLIANNYWEALNAENRVSLAVKFIPKDGPTSIAIINKYSKVLEAA